MSDSKWSEFESPDYRLQDLGRPAVFIIPVRALAQPMDGETLADDLNRFLEENFGAYTVFDIPGFGIWKGPGGSFVKDKSQIYEVSFRGKENIPLLIRKLARIAELTGEECIYLKAGQYSCLVSPRRPL